MRCGLRDSHSTGPIRRRLLRGQGPTGPAGGRVPRRVEWLLPVGPRGCRRNRILLGTGTVRATGPDRTRGQVITRRPPPSRAGWGLGVARGSARPTARTMRATAQARWPTIAAAASPRAARADRGGRRLGQTRPLRGRISNLLQASADVAAPAITDPSPPINQ